MTFSMSQSVTVFLNLNMAPYFAVRIVFTYDFQMYFSLCEGRIPAGPVCSPISCLPQQYLAINSLTNTTVRSRSKNSICGKLPLSLLLISLFFAMFSQARKLTLMGVWPDESGCKLATHSKHFCPMNTFPLQHVPRLLIPSQIPSQH